jgi:hypothetical protein
MMADVCLGTATSVSTPNWVCHMEYGQLPLYHLPSRLLQAPSHHSLWPQPSYNPKDVNKLFSELTRIDPGAIITNQPHNDPESATAAEALAKLTFMDCNTFLKESCSRLV